MFFIINYYYFNKILDINCQATSERRLKTSSSNKPSNLESFDLLKSLKTELSSSFADKNSCNQIN